ncbi:DNA topoisomerase [Radiomyces spectabilis]|uniref:DNA topoisomerase n=1 Tax=Radiomyces spectabilis TaxID=64574 RepID=UPI002220C986|nr:DNA topoisomerase [Radiomyces spectabilis]KAI8368269.1 DNA topoisomerase [Radiomyces spectabilis]
MRILCVAEKPSAAKKVADILSQSNYRTISTNDTYTRNYTFNYTHNGRSTHMIMTSLRGHLLELDFPSHLKHWRACDPIELFEATVHRSVPENNEALADNLRREARNVDVLFIWTDCDREGEAIGAEAVEVCRAVNPRLEIWRARFSAMDASAIHRAAQNPTTMDERQVQAVFVRSELDLRIGAAFTRLQTFKLANFFQDRKVVSYGSCQFPTLGFVVDRYKAIENFVPEEFWKINLSYTQTQDRNSDCESITTQFNWKRGHLFDRWATFVLYEMCYQNPMATITKVQRKEVTKWKPLPLTTVEMQKVGCRVLRMTGERIMKVAEELYTQGLISYPRTETDQFDSNFDFHTLIEKQTRDNRWGQYAVLLRDGEFERPRNGRNNDKAHPPIHPTEYKSGLSGDHLRVYEFIVRRFLGCCWKNAVGFETAVEVKVACETFDAKGLVILERNFLEVYTYDKWKGNYLPEFNENDQFMPTVLEMKSSVTQPPKLLTEYDLISLMEKNEIGTDATIAEHIQKILDRQYAFKNGQYFRPSTLGIALVLGYDEIGFDSSLSKPFLRREMEADLKQICEGRKLQNAVLQQSIERYRQMFFKSVQEFGKIITSMQLHYRATEDQSGGAGAAIGIGVSEDEDEGGDDGDHGDNQRPSGGGNARRSTGTRGRGRGGRGSSNRGDGGAGRRTSGRGRGRGRGRGGGQSSSNDQSSNGPPCECDFPSVSQTVRKAGPNKGREFFVCGRQTCNFFAWNDDRRGPS